MKNKLLFSICILLVIVLGAVPVGKLVGSFVGMDFEEPEVEITAKDIEVGQGLQDDIEVIFAKYEPVSEENRDALRDELQEYLDGALAEGKIFDLRLDEENWTFYYTFGPSRLSGGVRYFQLPDENGEQSTDGTEPSNEVSDETPDVPDKDAPAESGSGGE